METMMYSVAVVMSTYNGETYLREQIDSVLAQKDVRTELYIRDDGSSDGTEGILREYRRQYHNIHVMRGKNAGVGNSFYRLLYKIPADYDYYAFADQDDIWKEQKLSRAISLLQKSGASLYASNQECVNSAGESMGLRYRKNEKIHLTPLSIMSRNMLAGCTMVFPKKTFDALVLPEHRPSEYLLRNRIHDVWTAMVASMLDGIVYDDESFMLYRQHAHNVVGASEETLSKRVKAIFEKLRSPEQRNGRSLIAGEIVSKFAPDKLEYPLLYDCADAGSLKNRIRLCRNADILREYTGESKPALIIKILIGLF